MKNIDLITLESIMHFSVHSIIILRYTVNNRLIHYTESLILVSPCRRLDQSRMSGEEEAVKLDK